MSDVENNFKESMDWNYYIDSLKKFNNLNESNITNNDFLLNKYEYGKRKTKYLFEFYAPFDYVNKEARIVIVGITPGWTQAKNIHNFMLSQIKKGVTNKELLEKEAKYKASFCGRMKQNLVRKLDDIGISESYLKESSSELWLSKRNLFHPTSLLRFPVFVKKNAQSTNKYDNYGGHIPPILSIEGLKNRILKTFYEEEIKQISNKSLIIPLGTAVSNVMRNLISENKIEKDRCILDFPHPTTGFGQIKGDEKFEVDKEKFKKKVLDWFE